jgi:hypothetical protein
MNRSRRRHERLVSRQRPAPAPAKEVAQNALHLASAALGLYFGLAGRRTVAPAA